MKRKLIKQGKEGLTMYIPKKFIDKHNLVGGDELEVEELENSLILSVETIKKKIKTTQLKLLYENEGYIRDYIIHLYVLGYTKITLYYNSPKEFEYIENSINNYVLGFEITQESKNFVVIENILEVEQQKREILLRRSYLLIEQMFTLILEEVKQNSFKSQQKIIKISYGIEKYVNFLKRRVYQNRINENKSEMLYEFYGIFRNLSTSLKMMYLSLSNNNNNTIKYGYIKEFEHIFKNLEKSYFSNDLESLSKSGNFVSEKLIHFSQNISQDIQRNEIQPFLYFNSFLVSLLSLHSKQNSVLLSSS